MKKSFSSRWHLLLDALFDQPLTSAYWLMVVVYLVVGAVLVHPDGHMPDLGRHLAMGGVMVGLARLFNSPLGRWAWLGFMLLLAVLLGLDVAIALLA
ncbi:MAG: hypothetical protein EOO62_40350 [Hymenobacter sp.]|nr:MAG: hypothetical protein EOO62_40350 [Hymenobacter sp.]